MAEDFLNEIVAYKKSQNIQKKDYYKNIREKLELSEYNRYHLFRNAIRGMEQLSLIAEIKKASPSKGVIRENFDVAEIAKVYEESGAAVISVLSEDKYFLGKTEYVKKVSDQFHLPVLMKDFFIEENQIYEALVNGASAVLLIVAILNDNELQKLMRAADSLDLDCLVEVHNQQELDRALHLGAQIIGINNRDLHTFEVSMDTCRTLIPKIPSTKIVVAESGIKTNDDILELTELGANAVLIGETFMREEDIASKIKEIMEPKK